MSEGVEKIGRFGAAAAQAEKRPYSIELWDVRAHSLERVLAGALNAQLAGRSSTPCKRNILNGGSCCGVAAEQSRTRVSRY